MMMSHTDVVILTVDLL